MVIEENDYILGFWFAEAGNGDDWLMILLRRGKKYIGEYRFRYKKDDKIFDSEDKKSFYSFSAKTEDVAEDEMVKKLNGFFEMVKLRYSVRAKYIEVKGDFHKFSYLGAQEDFFHIKTGGKEEMEKYIGGRGGR